MLMRSLLNYKTGDLIFAKAICGLRNIGNTFWICYLDKGEAFFVLRKDGFVVKILTFSGYFEIDHQLHEDNFWVL